MCEPNQAARTGQSGHHNRQGFALRAMTTCLATQSRTEKYLRKPGLGRCESMEILNIRARVLLHDVRDLAGKPDSRQGTCSESAFLGRSRLLPMSRLLDGPI
jgi:hypothetical protein